MFDFSSDGFNRILARYTELQGQTVVLTTDGQKVLDSSNRYAGSEFAYRELLSLQEPAGRINGLNYVMQSDSSNAAGLIVANIISQEQLTEKIRMIQVNIFFVAILCILISILLSMPHTLHVRKRVGTILRFMNRVKTGDLTSRINYGYQDEIGQIALGLNDMCDDLQKHIEVEYIANIERKNAELKQKSAALTALQTQINPHFLYNTLEAIRMKAIANKDTDVGNMIFILSKLFRSMVKERRIVVFSTEIENDLLYLNLFKIRYKNRLEASIQVDNRLNDFGIINHTLQPIIENYILYGFNSSKADNRITIKAELDDLIRIELRDNGKGISSERLREINDSLSSFELTQSSTSIGLANIDERIKLIFGQEFGLTIDSVENEGTTVVITLPAKTLEDLKQYV